MRMNAAAILGFWLNQLASGEQLGVLSRRRPVRRRVTAVRLCRLARPEHDVDCNAEAIENPG